MRADSNVLCISTTICQAKNFVSRLEALFPSAFSAKFFDGARELYPQNFGRSSWYRILTLALEQVHAIQAKGIYFDKRLRLSKFRFGYVSDMESLDWAFAILDVCSTLGSEPFKC